MNENQKKYNDALDKVVEIFIKEVAPALKGMTKDEIAEGINAAMLLFIREEDGDNTMKCGVACCGSKLNMATMFMEARQNDETLNKVIEMSGISSHPLFDMLRSILSDDDDRQTKSEPGVRTKEDLEKDLALKTKKQEEPVK